MKVTLYRNWVQRIKTAFLKVVFSVWSELLHIAHVQWWKWELHTTHLLKPVKKIRTRLYISLKWKDFFDSCISFWVYKFLFWIFLYFLKSFFLCIKLLLWFFIPNKTTHWIVSFYPALTFCANESMKNVFLLVK